MRLDEMFKNLGYLAATFGAQIRTDALAGLLLSELDLTGTPPREIAHSGPAQLLLSDGETLRIAVDRGPTGEEVRFVLDEERLKISGGDRDTVVRVMMPAPAKISLAGSGRVTAARLARDGEVSIAGSGKLEIAAVDGGKLAVSIAGSGRLAADGYVDALALSIVGSGSCDAEGLVAHKAVVSIAGSGDAIFTCNGEVAANLMGSGNVIVRGGARCSVHSMGSGTVTCERATEAAD